jgi:Kelch motif
MSISSLRRHVLLILVSSAAFGACSSAKGGGGSDAAAGRGGSGGGGGSGAAAGSGGSGGSDAAAGSGGSDGGAGNASDASAQPPVPSQVGMTCDTAPRLAFPTIVTPNAVYLVEGIATEGSGFLSTTMMIGRAASGSLDPATCTLTSGVTVPVAEDGMSVATVASSVYLIGGGTNPGLTGTQTAVYRAEITNGTLTPFSVATLSGGATPVVLQTSRYAAEVVQVQNYVYIIGGWSSVNETNVASIERAQVDLATGNFVTNFAPAMDPKTGNPATLVVPRSYAVAVHLGSWIYVLGGRTQTADQPVPVSGPPCQNEIQRASLDATGNLSSFSQVGTLPSGLCGPASYVSGNTMYVLGGATDFNLTTGATTVTDAVLTAAIAADGTLGAFTASSVKLSYPVGLAGEAVIGKTVYLFNGSEGGTGATTSIQAVTFP